MLRRMTESFDIVGVWSVDSGRNISDWTVGTLHYKPNQVRLEIIDQLDNTGCPFPDTSVYDRVYGFANTGELVTLSNVRYSGGTTRIPGISTEIYALENFIISDKRLDVISEPDQIVSASFSMTYFDKWLPMPAHKVVDDKSRKELSVTVGPLKSTRIAKIPKIGTNTYLERNEESSLIQSDKKLEFDIRADLTIKEIPADYLLNHLVSRILSLSDLMTIIFGRNSTINYLRVACKDSIGLNVFFSQHTQVIERSEKNIELDLSFEKLLPEFENLLNSWLTPSKELDITSHDWLQSIRHPSTVENELINLTQGIEAFYRNENSMSLKTKMMEMFDSLPSNYLESALKTFDFKHFDSATFAERLKNTRVFLTHGTEKEPRFDGLEVVKATLVFRELERYFLLSELGLSNETLTSLQQSLRKLENTTITDDEFKL